MDSLHSCTLGELGKVCMCKRILKEQTSQEGDIPFYKISTFGGEPDCYINRDIFEEYKRLYNYPKKGDVLISAAGTLGRTVVYDGEERYFQDSNIVWLDNDESVVLNSYLYYYYKIIKWFSTTGSTINRLYNENIERAIIYFPSLDEQRKIVSILESLDNKIVNNKAIIKELEDAIRLIYGYWFTQFDFPDENGKPYCSGGGKMVWNDELKHEIPEGWEVVSLSSLIRNVKNGDWGNEKRKSGDDICVNCFRGADYPSVSDSYVMTAPTRYIKRSNSDRLLEDGDLIVEISGGSPTQATGRIAYINQGYLNRSDNPMDCTNFCKSVSLKNKAMQYWFYQYWLKLYDAGNMFNYESKTTGLKNLMFDEFVDSVFIAMPPMSLLESFHEKVSMLYERAQLAQRDSAELAALRDWLLPMLMNGQVQVN